MELARRTSKSGKVYRIWEELSAWTMYTIEFLKVAKHKDGTTCNVWFPAYEPKQKVFKSIAEARLEFENFLNA